MAHPSTIAAYAVACHEEQSLQRRLEAVRADKSRLHPQVVEHLENTGPLTCDLNNTDDKVTLSVRRVKQPTNPPLTQQGGGYLGAKLSIKSVIECVVSRPNRSSVA